MCRPPPCSTLFPYTTLFRSVRSCAGGSQAPGSATCCSPPTRSRTRSEEHTSELQSRGHLVCRLLPEKKKMCHKRGYLQIHQSKASLYNRKMNEHLKSAVFKG